MVNSFSKLSNLQQRIIVGLLGASALIFGVLINEWTYFVLFFCITLFSCIEFHGLINTAGLKSNKVVGVALGMIFFTGSFLVSNNSIGNSFYLIYPSLVFLLFFIELFQVNEKPFERTAMSLLGVVYTALPYALLNQLVFKFGAYDYRIVVGIFLLLWANDTGGYFGGKYLGKHKLFERISPKKTWEGSFAGGILSLSVAVGLFYWVGLFSLPFWLGLSAIIVLAGSLGDLVESQFKRSLNIKDSGSSIPGHGGFLDRFDGLIVSLPFMIVYFELL